ncbi:MFS transporter [Bradyrhizobium sp. CCGB12]|uniref:MFS transporter n=1 Tax=Bradyrhizobium sp. CCGB12 TaxID=2949632 RepID=UPI0020B297F1|nr:MFS transporter [Bradyrhizobium sp. CCGB12]MCP3392146.1 MFS transporter [Bradyrhizobium sp. CCGB12]
MFKPSLEEGAKLLPKQKRLIAIRYLSHIGMVALASQQYLSIALIYSAIPVILRANGASLQLVGLYSTAFFAFTVSILWAPIVDRWSLNRLGLRRSWILLTQVATTAVLTVMAFLNPKTDFMQVFLVSVALASVAATQRIATLGYIAEALDSSERPLGATLLGWGRVIGHVIGGAVCLQLIEIVGWRTALLGLALLLAVFAGWVFAIPEPLHSKNKSRSPQRQSIFLRNNGLWTTAALIAPGVAGIALAFAMVQLRLVDLGFAAADIGWIGAISNVLTYTIVAPLTTAILGRMAPNRGVMLGCAVLAIGFGAFAIIDCYVTDRVSAVASVGIVFAALAVQHVTFTNWFLALARLGKAGTDVTFLTSVMSAFALTGFAASGLIAAKFGYRVTLILPGLGYALSGLLAMGFIRAANLSPPRVA